MIVSLEAVPRDRDALAAFAEITAAFPRIDFINVPDLKRFEIRSWEACGIIRDSAPGLKAGLKLMPHLRARDFDPAMPFPLADHFRRLGIGHVLVISGDPEPASPGAPAAAPGLNPADSPTIPFIKKLKTEIPELKIYAAFDPYRSNIRYELDYVRAKEEAGAEGFFSQPFFDLRLLEIYAEYLERKEVYWGVSPVLSTGNRAYWESRNRAIFPKSFRTDLGWNIDFGRRVLSFCEAQNFNFYLMPIKIDLKAYLSGLFG
jgi:methylenetetrahydrofolate reductase (NADPH)